MLKIQIISAIDHASYGQKKELADFLVTHLGTYGDAYEDVMKCLDYALDQALDKGGFAVTASENDELMGVVVVNKTGMSGYIPENILVYIAVQEKMRGKGIGKKLMKAVLEMANGDIALHVEADNPAKKLYEEFGFTNKYLEMRLKR